MSFLISFIIKEKLKPFFPNSSQKNYDDAQRGARTHDPEIKSLMLYRLS